MYSSFHERIEKNLEEKLKNIDDKQVDDMIKGLEISKNVLEKD